MDPPRSKGGTSHLDVAVTSTAGSVRIKVCGEVDLSNSALLQATLLAVDYGQADTVDLDLRRLAFCDTRGCQVLLHFERKARLSGHVTRIHDAAPTVRKVMGLLATEDSPDFD